jgi:hypothetical protein
MQCASGQHDHLARLPRPGSRKSAGRMPLTARHRSKRSPFAAVRPVNRAAAGAFSNCGRRVNGAIAPEWPSHRNVSQACSICGNFCKARLRYEGWRVRNRRPFTTGGLGGFRGDLQHHSCRYQLRTPRHPSVPAFNGTLIGPQLPILIGDCRRLLSAHINHHTGVSDVQGCTVRSA